MENKYTNYQNMVTSVTVGINQLDGVCRHLSMDSQADELNGISRRLQDHIFSVGIMGEFKRGKSTVINALLGGKIVPADIAPCSATLNYIRWDAARHAVVNFKDGSSKEISVDELSDYITKLTEESEEQSKNVTDATVFYPCPFCQNGVQIIDTPGLNDDERMNAISESVIPTLDAIIMVTVPGSPFGISEAEFVRNKLMTSDLGRVLFVVNKMDTVDEEDRDRILEHIRAKIKSSVLEKMKGIYGEDSEEYIGAKEKLAGIRVIGISAKQALKGKLYNDPKLVSESGFCEFEHILSTLLTEERGLLELIHPVNQIFSVANTSLDTIRTRIDALNLDAAEFERIQNEAIERIKETRKRKKKKIETLKAKGKTLYADLLPDVECAYDEVGRAISDYVHQLPISEEDIRDKGSVDALSQKLNGEIRQRIEDAFSVATERVMNKVDDQLGKDVEKLQEFNRELNATINGIRLEISEKPAISGENMNISIRDSLIETGVMYGAMAISGNALPGVGGIISGWREHGIKGALVGGISGYGIGMIAASIAGTFLPVGLPFLLITGLASTFGGRAVTCLVFGKGKDAPDSRKITVESVRAGMISSVESAIVKMKEEKTVENWLKDFCENSYNSVAGNIDQEWENTLITLEENLSRIKADIQMNETNKQHMQATMNEYVQTIQSVLDDMKPVREKLSSALNGN